MAHPRVPIKRGQVFGSLTALSAAGLDARQQSLWRCRCGCGNTTTVRASELKRGTVKRCSACGAASGGAKRRKYKDLVPDGAVKNTAEYQAWTSVRWQAKTEQVPLEPDWDDFEVFFVELGPRPDEDKDWVLGRINSELGFVRGNVQWQPLIRRLQHKSTSLWWHVDGERFPSANAAAEALDVSRATIRNWCQGLWDRKARKRGKRKAGCWTEPQFPERG